MSNVTKIDSFMQQQLMMTKKSKVAIIQQQDTVYCRQLFVGTYTSATCSNFPTKLDSEVEFKQQLEKMNPKVLNETFKLESCLGNVFILINTKKELPAQPLQPKPKPLPLKTLVVALFSEYQMFVAIAFEHSKIVMDYHSIVKNISSQLLDTGLFIVPQQVAPPSQSLVFGYNAFNQSKVIMFQGVKMPYVQQPMTRLPRQQLTCLVFIDQNIQDLEAVIQKLYYFQITYPFVFFISCFKNLPKKQILKRIQAAKYSQYINIVEDASNILPDLLFTALSFQFFDDTDNETGFKGVAVQEIQQYCDAILEINRRDFEQASIDQDERMRQIQAYSDMMRTCHDADQMDNYKMQVIILKQEMVNMMPPQEFDDTFPERNPCAEEQDMIVEPSYVTMMGIRMTLVKPDLKGSIDTEIQMKKALSSAPPEITNADDLRKIKCPSITSQEREMLPYVVAFLRDPRARREDGFEYLSQFQESLMPMLKDQDSSSSPDKLFDLANLVICCENLYQTDMGRFQFDDKKDPNYQTKLQQISQIKIWLQRSYRMVDDYGVFEKLSIICGDTPRNVFFVVVDGMVNSCFFDVESTLNQVKALSEEQSKAYDADQLQIMIDRSIYREQIEQLYAMQIFMSGQDVPNVQLIINELAKADQQVYPYPGQFPLDNFQNLVQNHFPQDNINQNQEPVQAFVDAREEVIKNTRIQNEKAEIKKKIQTIQDFKEDRLNNVVVELVPVQGQDFQTVEHDELLVMINKFIDAANNWDDQLQLIDSNFADPDEFMSIQDKNDIFIRLSSMLDQIIQLQRHKIQKSKKTQQQQQDQAICYTFKSLINQIRQFNCVSVNLRNSIDSLVERLINEENKQDTDESSLLKQIIQAASDEEVQLINSVGSNLPSFTNNSVSVFVNELKQIQDDMPYKLDQIATVDRELADTAKDYFLAGGMACLTKIPAFLSALTQFMMANKDKMEQIKSDELKERLQGYVIGETFSDQIKADQSLIKRIMEDIYLFLDVPKPLVKKDEFPGEYQLNSGLNQSYQEFIVQLERNMHVGQALQELMRDLIKILQDAPQALTIQAMEAEMTKFHKPLYAEIEQINRFINKQIVYQKVYKLYELITVLQTLQDYVPYNYDILTQKETADVLIKSNIDLSRVMDQVRIYMDLKEQKERENQKLKVTAELQLLDQHIKIKANKSAEQERACGDIFRFQPLNSDYTLNSLLKDLVIALDLSKLESFMPTGTKMSASQTDPDDLLEKTQQYAIIKNCINQVIASKYVASAKNDAVYGFNLFWKYTQFGDDVQQAQVTERTIRLILRIYEDLQKNYMHQTTGNLGGSQSLNSSLVGTVTLQINSDINTDYTNLLERFEGAKPEDDDFDATQEVDTEPINVIIEIQRLTATLMKMK